MDSTTVYVSIGRNVGDAPMADTTWLSFQLDVEGVLYNAGLDVVTRANGSGVYDGVAEDCHVVTAIGAEVDQAKLAQQLSATAAMYLQETIAYSVTTTLWADAEGA